MKRKLSCADFAFPLLEPVDALTLVGLLEFEGVDIGLFEGRGRRSPSHELSRPERSGAALSRALRERDLALADVFFAPGANFNDAAVNQPDAGIRRRDRDQFERVIDYTLAAGGRHITVLPGVYWKQESRRASLNRSSDELSWRCAGAAAHGCTLAIEPHIGSIVPSPKEVLTLLEMTPGLTLTLDYGQFIAQGCPNSEVEPLLRSASHQHIRGARRGRLQTSFATNLIDYTRVLEVLGRLGYRGYLCVEYVWTEWERCNETDNLSETIRFRDFLRANS